MSSDLRDNIILEWCYKDDNIIETSEIFVWCDHAGSKDLKNKSVEYDCR